MKTQDFIAKCALQLRNGERVRGTCASVFAEGDTVYSYGYHFPLLFKVVSPGGSELLVCNDTNFSVTTKRHQSYCKRYADIVVPLYGAYNYQGVCSAIIHQIEQLQAELDKKRQGTKIYSTIHAQLTQMKAYKNLLD